MAVAPAPLTSAESGRRVRRWGRKPGHCGLAGRGKRERPGGRPCRAWGKAGDVGTRVNTRRPVLLGCLRAAVSQGAPEHALASGAHGPEGPLGAQRAAGRSAPQSRTGWRGLTSRAGGAQGPRLLEGLLGEATCHRACSGPGLSHVRPPWGSACTPGRPCRAVGWGAPSPTVRPPTPSPQQPRSQAESRGGPAGKVHAGLAHGARAVRATPPPRPTEPQAPTHRQPPVCAGLGR